MDIWKILGIEATKDKRTIKKAYRAKLPDVNPEDDQDAFMELREAYEEALYFAETEDNTVNEEEPSEADDFRRELEGLYRDFYRRIDTEEWEKLLSCDFASALDTKKDAEEIVLSFFMDWCVVPCDVVRLLDRHFGLKENQSELFEKYPELFVQHVILEAADGADSIPFEYFKVKDYMGVENFFERYHKVREHIFHGDFNGAKAVIAEIDNSGVDHPYLEMRRAEIAAAEGNRDYGLKTAAMMSGLFPEEIEVLMFCGRMERTCGNPAEGRKYFEKVAKLAPEHADSRFEAAACMIEEGDCKGGKEALIELSREFPGSDAIMEKLGEVGAVIAADIEEKEAAGQADDYDLFELADCYTDMEHFEGALEVLDRMTIPYDREVKAAMIRLVCLLSLKEYRQALGLIPAYIELVEKHPEEDRKKYITKILYMEAGAYASMGMGKEEKESLRKIIDEVDPEYALAYAMMARRLHEDGYYQEAYEYAKKAIDAEEDSFEGYFEAGRALYELGDSNGALTLLIKARNMEPYHLRNHMYLLKSLLDQHRAAEAEEYLRYLEENGAECLDMEFLRGRIEILKGNDAEAAAIIRAVIEKARVLPEETRRDEIGNMGELYNTLANLEVRPGENFDDIMKITEEGLEFEPGFGPLLQMKGNILYDTGEPHLALEEYKKIAERYPEHNAVYWDIGCCYEILGQLEDAYKAYVIQTERRPDSDSWNSCARVCMAMGRSDLAESYLNRAMETDDTNPMLYTSYGKLMEQKNFSDRALEAYACARRLGKEYRLKCRDAYSKAIDLLTREQRGDEALELAEAMYNEYGRSGDLLKIHLLTQVFGRPERAMENLVRWAAVTGTSKESFEYQSKYAEILRLAGQPEKAALICRRFIDEAPGACFFGGNIYYNLGEYEEALELFEQGMSVCPQEKKNFLGAAKAALRLGRKEDSQRFAQAGLDTYCEDRYAEAGPFFLQEEVVYGALLILTGKAEEGFALIEKEMWGKKCMGCNFRECIDAYIELAEMYDFAGDRQKALDMACRGFEAAEFDFDLICIKKRLEEEIKC